MWNALRALVTPRGFVQHWSELLIGLRFSSIADERPANKLRSKSDMKNRRGSCMEPLRSLPPCEHRRGGGVEGNCSAARAKVANEPQCRQAFVLHHRIVTLIARNRRFTVDLSGACP